MQNAQKKVLRLGKQLEKAKSDLGQASKQVEVCEAETAGLKMELAAAETSLSEAKAESAAQCLTGLLACGDSFV